MQGKGIVKALFIVLLLVTAYQLMLMWPTYRVEKEAASSCDGMTSGQCYTDYLDSISEETVFSIPLVKDFTYSELKGQQIGFGLDLKGGMSAVVQVDLREHLRSTAGKAKGEDPIFDQALDNAQRALASSQGDYLTVFGQEWDKVAGQRPLGDVFSYNQAYSDVITLSSTTDEVINALREDTKSVVKQTFNMLTQRIDKFGVVQPSINLDESRDLILVELPGVDNPKIAYDLITQTANLEFWDLYKSNEVFNGFIEADRDLQKRMGMEVDSSDIDSLNPLGAQGPLLSKLSIMPGSFSVGIADKSDMATINALLNDSISLKRYFPQDVEFMWSSKPIDLDPESPGFDPTKKNYELYAIKKGYTGKAKLTGDVVRSARTETDPQTGEVGVNLEMEGEGPRIWGEWTKKASVNNDPIAIALDNRIISAPRVNQPILGGSSRITGQFSVPEADNFANMLEIGSLPASPKIIQTAVVGPTLGAENIKNSITALIVGFLLVLLFMIAYYSGGGVVSILALFANILFIVAALSSLGTVLTLPGIAGIVLTIGMAVDANVIIFERIREEQRDGKSLLLAIKDGFQHSYSAIIDANITTFLTAMILFYFGLGPIKGFATVLMVGVIMSVITAVLLGRLIIDWWTVDQKKEMSFSMGWSEGIFSNLSIDWLGKRKIAYAISGVIIVAGIVSMMTRGFDLGVDFAGGYTYTVEFADNVSTSTGAIKDALTAPFGGDEPIVKEFDGSNRYSITTKYTIGQEIENAGEEVMKQLHAGIKTIAGADLTIDQFSDLNFEGTKVTSSNSVQPTIADDIQNSSRNATIVALLAIFGYILIRFRKWQFSLGAVAALFHDVAVVLAIFSLGWGFFPWSMEIDQAFIAALLTVVGYSINDTVVVFDRIREFMNSYTSRSKEEIINMAVNSTVSRTIITSVTTLFVVLILFIVGSGSIKGFAFALLVGVVVGTYSSIFVATPIMSDTTRELKAKTSKKSGGSTLARKKAEQAQP